MHSSTFPLLSFSSLIFFICGLQALSSNSLLHFSRIHVVPKNRG
jgi:hypothetical protein